MRVEPIAEGLWRWITPHPDAACGLQAEVGSVYLEGDDAVVLIDPLVPLEPADGERFWRALDRDLARLAQRPLIVLLSCAWHRRSAADIVARHAGRPGTRLLAHAESAPFVADLTPHGVREREPLPGGIEAHLVRDEPVELVFWILRHATLVVADALIGIGAGRLRLCPASWLGGSGEGEDRLRYQLRPALARLLDLPIVRVLPAHGAPVLEGGRDAIAEALAAVAQEP